MARATEDPSRFGGEVGTAAQDLGGGAVGDRRPVGQ